MLRRRRLTARPTENLYALIQTRIIEVEHDVLLLQRLQQHTEHPLVDFRVRNEILPVGENLRVQRGEKLFVLSVFRANIVNHLAEVGRIHRFDVTGDADFAERVPIASKPKISMAITPSTGACRLLPVS